MNEVNHHPKLNVQILLRQGVSQAGSTLSALLEVDSRAESEIGLGSMIVELIGTEGESSKRRPVGRVGGGRGRGLRRSRCQLEGKGELLLDAAASREEDFHYRDISPLPRRFKPATELNPLPNLRTLVAPKPA